MDLDFSSVIGKNTGKTNEDESFSKTDEKTPCPYDKCNGSGFISSIDDRDYVEVCKCHKDKVMLQKLKNSNIHRSFLGKTLDDYDNETKMTLFRPKKEITPFQPSARIKTVIDESTNNFIKRNYTHQKEKRDIQEVIRSFCETNEKLMGQGEQTANLLLFGEPANGKTSLATQIGLYFLKKNKKVYFESSQNLIDHLIDKKIDVKSIAKDYDVLIIDELFNEYHTDTQYAKKKLKEIFKLREEYGKITVCTSNGTLKDFELLYGPSFMSLIKGTFFLFLLERETDGRVEKFDNMYNLFNL